MNCQNPQGYSEIRMICANLHKLSKSACFVKNCTICQNPLGFLKIARFLKNLHDLPKSTQPKTARFTEIRTICQNPHNFCFHNFSESAKICMNCQNPQGFTKIHKFCQNLHKSSKSACFVKNHMCTI